MTYILLTLFVYGIHKVIWSFADFFDWDLEKVYKSKNDCLCPAQETSKIWKILMKPIFYCNVCMSSLWGTICYFLILQETSIQLWILHCIISAGVITIINRFMER